MKKIILFFTLFPFLLSAVSSLDRKIYEITNSYYAEEESLQDFIELNTKNPSPFYEEAIAHSQGKIQAYKYCLAILLRNDDY